MADESSAPDLRSDKSVNNLQKIEDINLQFKERDIKAKARSTGLKYIDLKNAPINQDALQLTSWAEVEKANAIPFDLVGKVLRVACVDHNSEACQKLINRFTKKGYEIDHYLCSEEGIASTKHFFENIRKQEEIQIETKVEEDVTADWKELFKEKGEIFQSGTGPEMLNILNLQAARFHASDVHFQPEQENIVIRMRRDGQLYEVMKMEAQQYQILVGEIKRSAGMKMNVQNVPQDGNYEFEVNERKVSVRVSDLPSKYGDSMVLRILDTANAIVKLDKLGFSKQHSKSITEKLKRDRGLILVTGPTGSGKTSTLYSCLNFINTAEKKIITLEDPIEYELQNIVQSEIEEDEGYTFASGLRSVLRQDPDVIMVGEIRDKDAAEIALQASLTGHLVLSTVHANSAVATLPRLLNMGVKPYILSSGLEMVIAQRLVRKICEKCKKPAELEETAKEEIEKVMASLQKKGVELPKEVKIFSAEGCEDCAKTAYQGRVAIAEVLEISDEIRHAIAEGESSEEVLAKAEAAGFVTISEDGMMKVLQGVTTIEEVWKVLV